MLQHKTATSLCHACTCRCFMVQEIKMDYY